MLFQDKNLLIFCILVNNFLNNCIIFIILYFIFFTLVKYFIYLFDLLIFSYFSKYCFPLF